MAEVTDRWLWRTSELRLVQGLQDLIDDSRGIGVSSKVEPSGLQRARGSYKGATAHPRSVSLQTLGRIKC